MLGPLFLVTIAYCLLFSPDSSAQTKCGSPQDPLQGALLSALPQHSAPHPARGNHIYLLPDKFKYVCPHEHHADWVYTLLGSG